MSIKYNNKVIAGKYKEQVIPFANTVDAGIAKIATQEEINEGVSNETIVTPVYLAQKQDKLTAGNGIHIDATNTISSKLSPDKTTIVENENNTLTTVARQTVNENILFDWEGTEAEYHQAIMNGEIDPSWYCYITDDELAVSYNDVLSRTLVNIAPQGAEKLNVSKAYLTNDIYTDEVGYNQLLELKNNAYKNDVDYITANGVKKEIPYTLTRTGSKIVSAEYREFLTTFYEENGYTNYFTIDEENKNYTLPMGEIYGKLVDKDLSTLSETAKEVIKDLTGVSFGLFDTKISDHVLSYEESLGWALQGTYVYRDVVTGERYGYPDFYNKCLEEYKNSHIASNFSIIGTLTNNNNNIFSGFTSTDYITLPNILTISENTDFEIVINFTTGSDITTNQNLFSSLSTEGYGIALNIASSVLSLYLSSNGTSWDICKAMLGNSVLLPNANYFCKLKFDGQKYVYYLSQDGIEWSEECVVKTSLRVVQATKNPYIGYYNKSVSFSGSIDLNKSYIKINNELWWEAGLIRQNENGHKYYNIISKSQIDSIYNTYGIADFYGIDEENKRILLPRNKYFQQLTDDTTKVNELIKAGLPNITGTFALGDVSDTYTAYTNSLQYGDGAFYSNTQSTASYNESGQSTKGNIPKFDASRSNSIYGNSDTVQPQSSLKLLYYCVGNTKADTSWVNIVAQVDEGVKEIYDQKAEVLREIEDLRQDSITEIDTLRQDSITEVDTLRVTSVNEISTLNTSSLEQIDTLRSDSIQEVLSTKEDYLQELEDKRVSSNESLVETKNSGLQELVETSENLIEQSRLWAVGTEEENAEGSAKYWAKVAELSSSNVIFDTKVSDHILNDAEAYGWTLCGTKAYKEAVVGEHLGYPTFYETCLNEYEQSEVVDRLYSYNITTTGTLTKNDGVVNGFSASNYMTLPNIMPSVENWEYSLKIKFSDVSATQYAINVGKSGAYNFLFGLNGGKFTVWISSNNTSWDIASNTQGSFVTTANTYYYIKYGFNGNEYYLEYSTTGEENSYIRDITITSTTKIYQPSGSPNIGYGWTSSPSTNMYIDLNESYINIDGERWWTGATRFNTYRYKNGHEYYLEQDKQYVDQAVNMHTHNMYGINLEEQSIIIPHINRTLIESKQPSNTDSSWYNLYSDGWCEQGGLYDYGSLAKDWNVVNTNFLKDFINTNYSLNVQAGRNDSGTGGINNQAFVTAYTTNNFKTEVYGDGNSQYLWWQASGYTNLPNTKLTYTYMCTGNSQADTSWINVVEQVAEGAKEIYDTKEGVLQEIDILRQGSVDEIDTLRQGSVNEVDVLRQNSLQEMEDKRVASNESIIDTKKDSIQELVEISQDLINESRKWAIGTDEDNIEGSAKYWAGVAELSSSNAMFDIKVSDHVLKDSEAYGWGLQGTYIYREAVLNDHLGYPTFYDKCLEEYKNSFMAIPNVNTVGTLTNDKGVLSGFTTANYAKIPNTFNPEDNTWEQLWKITTGDTIEGTQYFIGNAYCFQIYLADSLFKLDIGNGTAWTSPSNQGVNAVNTNTTYYIKLIFDGTTYKVLVSNNNEDFVEEITVEDSTTQISHIFAIGYTLSASSSSSVLPFLGSIDLNESYIKINDQLWWEGGLVYQNENGHQYYDISDKDKVDEIYNAYGIAWFYGIDEENKRIFLPRNDWFAIQGVAPVVGNGLVFGLTDGTNYGSYAANANGNLTFHTDLYGKTVGSSKSGNGSSKYVGMGFTTDPTKSGIEAHLQSDDTKYLYICTANTKADTSWMTLTEQVEAGIKEVEDKRAESIQDIDTLRQTSVSEIDTLRETSVTQVDALRQESTQEIIDTKNTSLEEINTLKQDSITEIDTLRSNSIQEVLETKENFLEELEDKKISCVNLIEETKENGIQELVTTSEDLINESRKWAIGTENENAEGSAKFWAETAQLASSNALFDTKISDHILEGPELYGWALQGTWVYKEAVLGEHLGYPTFYEKCLEEKENATSTNITLGSNTVAIYINNNGHQFYDITDKEAVDSFYSTYGVADYYGIDTENERIFLPRNIKEKRYLVESKKATSSDSTWYNLYSDGWLEQGGIVASGSNSNTVTLPKSFKDTSYSVQLTNSKTATIANYAPVSNITANNTFVVYSNGDGCKGCNKYWLASGYTDSIDIKDKFIYYCVGNTKADTSWINLVEQVQEGVKEIYDEKVKSLEEIDTLRQDSVNEIDVLKANSVQEIVDTKNNSLKEVDDTTLRGLQSLAGASNALTHNQVTNCLLEIPQRIKLELTDSVLTLKAGSKVIVPNGFEEDGVTPKFDYVNIESDVIKEYTPSTDGSCLPWYDVNNKQVLGLFSDGINTYYYSGTEQPTTNYAYWYDTTNNIVKFNNNGTWTEGVYSLPFASVSYVNTGSFTSIEQVFNGFGHIGSTVWVDKGVKGLVPNGRNEDGTLNNIEFETQSVLTKTITNTDDIDCTIAIDSNRLYLYAKRDDRYYDEEQNYIIHSDIKMSFAYVGEYHSNNCVISDFKPKSTFRAIDYNDITNILSSGGGSTVSITEEYIGENEGYRLYSNGYFEQWGYIARLNNTSTDVTTTFAKPLDSNKWVDVYYRIGEFYKPKYTYTIFETTTYPAKTYYNQILLGAGNFNTETSQCISSSWWTLNGTTSYTSLTAIHPVKNDTLAGWGGVSWADSTQPYFKDIHWHVQGYILGV